jgi:hypothetical protein
LNLCGKNVVCWWRGGSCRGRAGVDLLGPGTGRPRAAVWQPECVEELVLRLYLPQAQARARAAALRRGESNL